MSDDPYQRIRRAGRTDLLRRVTNVGHAVTCARPQADDESDADHLLRLGAMAESMAAQLVADLLDEMEDDR